MWLVLNIKEVPILRNWLGCSLAKGLSYKALNLLRKGVFGTLMKYIYSISTICIPWCVSYFPCMCSMRQFTAPWVENKSNNVMQTLEFITTIKDEEILILWKASHHMSPPNPTIHIWRTQWPPVLLGKELFTHSRILKIKSLCRMIGIMMQS